MNVILLTVFIGLILVGFFVAFFLNQRRHTAYGSPERDSLLPLEEEGFRHEKPTDSDSVSPPAQPGPRRRP